MEPKTKEEYEKELKEALAMSPEEFFKKYIVIKKKKKDEKNI